MLTTALVGAAGGPDAVAGYGTGARLEYLLIPLVFGLGAPLVALVGTNIGAGQRARALRIALTGGAIAFALTEAVGLAAAIWPHAWLGLFGNDPHMLETGEALSAHRRAGLWILRPGPFAVLRLAGCGQLAWPLLSGLLRLVIAHRRRLAGAARSPVRSTWLFAALTLAWSSTVSFARVSGRPIAFGRSVQACARRARHDADG